MVIIIPPKRGKKKSNTCDGKISVVSYLDNKEGTRDWDPEPHLLLVEIDTAPLYPYTAVKYHVSVVLLFILL